MLKLLAQMGVAVSLDEQLGAGARRRPHATRPLAPYELVKTMRASILVLGPLLARCGEARVSLPGGCAIGSRPVDQHIKGLQAMGAEIDVEHGYIIARRQAPEGRAHLLRHGDRHRHREPDDGGRAGRRRRRVIENAAREPEVVDLAHCLNAMGAQHRRRRHRRHHHRGRGRACTAPRTAIMPDRIETGTFLVAAAATGGDVRAARHAAPTCSTRCSTSCARPARRSTADDDSIALRDATARR